MRWIPFLLLASCAHTYPCAEPDAPYTRIRGMKICAPEPYPDGDIERVFDEMERQVMDWYQHVEDIPQELKKHDVFVRFIDAAMSMECERVEGSTYLCENHIGGRNHGRNIYVAWSPCLKHTRFVHEVLHSVERYYLGGTSSRHDTPGFFGNGGVEWAANELELKSCTN